MENRGSWTTCSAVELAARASVPVARVTELTEKGILEPIAADVYNAGDVHRIRALAAFEAAGIPMDALLAASEDEKVTFAHYDQLHEPPGEPSEHSYAEFAASLGASAERLPALFAAFGLPEPRPDSRLSMDEERFIATTLEVLEGTGELDAALHSVRLFGDATRRTVDTVMGVYADIERRAPDSNRALPLDEQYRRLFVPWARIARWLPELARWLTSRHLSHAIDAYSVEQTEATLAEYGFVPARPVKPPAVAFVDLTGFTALAHLEGDDAAASVALRFSGLASRIAAPHGGRLVKALGDGVLLTFPDAASAVEASLDLLAALPGADLPPGHAGVHAGPIIERDGDVFGRTVNLAARVGDLAPAGSLYVTRSVIAAIAERPLEAASVGVYQLHGLGTRELWRVIRADSSE